MATVKFFDVSTYHIPSSTAMNVFCELIIAEYPEGYFLYLPDEDEFDQYPQWLSNIFKLALANQCYHIRIDADGHTYDELESFDW